VGVAADVAAGDGTVAADKRTTEAANSKVREISMG
jgi:hypothetical protein